MALDGRGGNGGSWEMRNSEEGGLKDGGGGNMEQPGPHYYGAPDGATAGTPAGLTG